MSLLKGILIGISIVIGIELIIYCLYKLFKKIGEKMRKKRLSRIQFLPITEFHYPEFDKNLELFYDEEDINY